MHKYTSTGSVSQLVFLHSFTFPVTNHFLKRPPLIPTTTPLVVNQTEALCYQFSEYDTFILKHWKQHTFCAENIWSSWNSNFVLRRSQVEHCQGKDVNIFPFTVNLQCHDVIQWLESPRVPGNTPSRRPPDSFSSILQLSRSS